MRVAVEFSGEGLPVGDNWVPVRPWSGHVSDGGPLCDTIEVDVVEQVDPAFFILPPLGGFARVDRRGEGHKVFCRRDALIV